MSLHCVDLSQGLNCDWLYDGVKDFLSDKGTFEPYLNLRNLSIFCAKAEYILAMKCLRMRIGEEFHDIEDVRFLLRSLNVTSYTNALNIIEQYYPINKFPQKAFYILEEFLKNHK